MGLLPVCGCLGVGNEQVGSIFTVPRVVCPHSVTVTVQGPFNPGGVCATICLGDSQMGSQVWPFTFTVLVQERPSVFPGIHKGPPDVHDGGNLHPGGAFGGIGLVGTGSEQTGAPLPFFTTTLTPPHPFGMPAVKLPRQPGTT